MMIGGGTFGSTGLQKCSTNASIIIPAAQIGAGARAYTFPRSLGLFVSLSLGRRTCCSNRCRGESVHVPSVKHSVPLSLGMTYFVQLHCRRKATYANLVKYYAIMLHFSDCNGGATFGISSKQVAVCTDSYQIPMEFVFFRSSSKLSLILGGGPLLTVLGVLSKIVNTTTTTTTILFYTIVYYTNFIVGAGCLISLTHPLHARI
jgi:hypothetical protein